MSARARVATAFGVGLLFGAGLVISGMTRPEKVQGFLDLAGRWDPSLAFVMGGAVAVAAAGFAWARRRSVSWLGAPMPSLPTRGVDARLLAGSAVFGVGWGLGGFCPGPAVVTAGSGSARALVFVAAMLVGSALFDALRRVAADADADDAGARLTRPECT
ncbi:MAG: DUF6691 family protein [Polyangiales bacterium]